MLDLAGIEGVTPHMLRRTVATAVSNEAGVDLAAELLGPTDPADRRAALHPPQRNGRPPYRGVARPRPQEGGKMSTLHVLRKPCQNSSQLGRFLAMTDLTATQLSERLGVTRRRALDLLRTETITGRQLANGTWLADSDAVARYEVSARRGSGRTLDAATAWGLLWELSGLEADWLSASTRARVRRRIRNSDASSIASAVASRTRVHRYAAANAERAAEGLVRTGRSAAGALGTDLIEDTRNVSGYVRSGPVDEYALTHFMIEQANGRDLLYENTLPVKYEGEAMPAAVVAADLAASTNTRERSAALSALEELRQQWLAAH